MYCFRDISLYFFRIAVAIDELGNVIAGPFFNDVMITEEGDKFGHEDETISSELGKNHINQPRTLKALGKSLRF